MASDSHVLHLPPELYGKIIAQVPQDCLQQTVLALTRALPYSPIPQHHLFQHIHLVHASQVVQLYQRLRSLPGALAIPWVRELSLETWTVDADVVVNLVRLLQIDTARVTTLSLFIGPNFAPEHLAEMFGRPIPHLRYISIRFRPYVQKATYYQFLKGAYFDSALLALSQWPPTSLSTLSIVQDPLDSDFVHKQTFAQPLVFFNLDPFTTLARSPYLQGLVSLRLRIPSRQVPRFISTLPGSLPSLQLLDLSTCAIHSQDLDNILMRFPKLRHVILDECALGLDRVDARGCLWDIGKRCALAGVRRAKEREGKLKNWLETIALSEYPAVSQAVAVQGADVQRSSRPVRKGRRGLATATISLRASPPKHSTSSLPATSLSPKAKLAVPRVYILPSFPTLATFATTSSHIQPEIYRQISVDFEKGWADGLAQLSAIRQRRRQSWRNGMRVVRFRNENGNDDGDGLDGLVDLDSDEDGEVEVRSAPVLCLSGATRDEKAHVVGCGHSVWSAVLKDYAVAVV